MFYTIYKTTNNINGKIYIGKHKTQDLDDGYLGSGKILHHAIKKHGIDNFIKEYLFIFDNEEDMNNKEKELVNESFIKEDTNYNIKIGGDGGWDYVNKPENKITWATLNKTHNLTERAHKAWRLKYDNDIEFRKLIHDSSIKARIALDLKYPNGTFYGKSHSEESKELMRKSKNAGKDNPQYGTMWIHSLELKVSKRINKNDDIPDGWYKGRKIKF